MDDYLTCLYRYVVDKRMPCAEARYDYLTQIRQEEDAMENLWSTFTAEQRKLYLAYEKARNCLDSMQEELLFRETFALAREIYA